MRARSTRPVASVRERAILANAQHWSGSIESVMTRRAATIASPGDARPLLPYLAYIAYDPRTYRQFGSYVLVPGYFRLQTIKDGAGISIVGGAEPLGKAAANGG